MDATCNVVVLPAFWMPNEPNNLGDNEDCVEVVKFQDGRPFGLNDVACDRKQPVVCDVRKWNGHSRWAQSNARMAALTFTIELASFEIRAFLS